VQKFSSGSFEKISLILAIRFYSVNNKFGDIPSNGTIKPMIYYSGYIVVLVPEVTPGLLAGAEPDAHQFNVTVCLKGVIKWRKTQNDIVPTQKLGQACMDE
jgi:hypothetical protein